MRYQTSCLNNTECVTKNVEPVMYTDPFKKPIAKILLVSLLVLLLLSIVILSWVPPISRDALTHHLAIPKLYVQHGGIYEIPSSAFSYYPMNLDLLYMLPLYFGKDIVPKFIHYIFALLTAWLINIYFKRRLGAGWALLGALFFLSIPIIVKLSITVYVDLGLVFFSTTSIMSLVKWMDSHFKLRFLILSAVSCGLALGTKYNGLLVLFILTVFVPLIYIGHNKHIAADEKETAKKNAIRYPLKAIGYGTIFCLVALTVFSPWMIKNYIWRENPVYPLYDNWFNPPKVASTEIMVNNTEGKLDGSKPLNFEKSSTRWSSFAIRNAIYEETWWEIALIPVRIFFQGQDNHPKYFDGKLNVFLFLLPFFAFIPIRNERQSLRVEKRIFLSFSLLYLLFAFFQADMRIRYIAPIIPLLVILAILGIKRIEELGGAHQKLFTKKLVPGIVILIAIAMLVANTKYLYNQFNYVKPFDYIRGRISRDDYIGKYLGEYPVLQYANTNLRHDAKILALFLGNRRYYSERELIFGKSMFRRLVKSVKSSDMLASELDRLGFTHLLIRYDIFRSWSTVQFNQDEKELLKTFFKGHLTPLFSKTGYGLLQFKPKDYS